MTYNVFEDIKSLVDIRDAVEKYGLTIERGGMVRCPFHSDGRERHPSAKLYTERFHCFTCARSWDIISFVGELFNLPPIEAVRKIDDDFSLGLFLDRPYTMTERRAAAAAAQQRQQDTARLKAFSAWEERACNTLASYLRMLDRWRWEFAPKTLEDKLHPLFIEACFKIDFYNHLYHEVFVVGSFLDKVEFFESHALEVEYFASRLFAEIKDRTAG